MQAGWKKRPIPSTFHPWDAEASDVYRMYIERTMLETCDRRYGLTKSPAQAAVVMAQILAHAQTRVYITARELRSEFYTREVVDAIVTFTAQHEKARLSIFVERLDDSEEVLLALREKLRYKARVRIYHVRGANWGKMEKFHFPYWHAIVGEGGHRWQQLPPSQVMGAFYFHDEFGEKLFSQLPEAEELYRLNKIN